MSSRSSPRLTLPRVCWGPARATGHVDDEQEKEDSFLEGALVTYVQGGEGLEIDYSSYKQGFSTGAKAKIRMMGRMMSGRKLMPVP